MARERRASWRRLVVLAVATALLVGGVLDAESWTWLAVAFVGGESAVRLAESWGRS